jgi:hypothetical protein
MFKAILLPLLLLAATCVQAAEGTELGLIPLQHRSAEELIPQLRPFLDEGGVISGRGQNLILRTSPGNLHEIRRIVGELDTRPRQLRITVRQGVGLHASELQREAYGGITGEHGQVVVPGSGDPRGARAELERGDLHGGVRYWSTRRRSDEANSQQILTLEGYPANIQVGKSFPVVTGYQRGPFGESASIEYRDADTGFAVLPRLRGDRVTLEIHPQRNVLSPGGAGVVDSQEAHTVVSGRLGEWIELGGALRERSTNQSGILYSTRERGEQKHRIWVKVEEVEGM